MLVLTRRLNQSIKIGDNIEVTIIEVRGDQVRLGVSAPRDVSVHRKEVYLQIQNGLELMPQAEAPGCATRLPRANGAPDCAGGDPLTSSPQPANA